LILDGLESILKSSGVDTQKGFRTSIVLNAMENDLVMYASDASRRVEQAYRSEKPRFLARLRAAGRTWRKRRISSMTCSETMERLHLVSDIQTCCLDQFAVFGG